MIYFLLILLVLIIGLFAAGYYVFASTFDMKFNAKPNDDPNFIDSDADLMRPTARMLYANREACHEEFSQLPFRELEVTSFDGLKLKGYLLEGDPKEVVICVHGYKSGMEEDYCDKIKIYRDRGTTVLLMNDRAHGNSEGRYLGFSELDRFDVAKWVDKINEMYDNPRIYLHGLSMGGATVIHCADMKLKNVCGIIDDCGFNSILGISKALSADMYHLPFFPIGYLAWFWAKVLNHVDFNKSIGEECVRKADVPILFFHGKSDAFVPTRMSESMYEACITPKELHLIDNCGHAAAYICAPEEYTDAVNRLLDGKITESVTNQNGAHGDCSAGVAKPTQQGCIS